MGMYDMHHYWNEEPDGTIHVQNMAMGQYGQHHVHIKKDFKKWSKTVTPEALIKCEGKCGCGMKPGETVDGDPKRLRA